MKIKEHFVLQLSVNIRVIILIEDKDLTDGSYWDVRININQI
jgi:hypothetical protein